MTKIILLLILSLAVVSTAGDIEKKISAAKSKNDLIKIISEVKLLQLTEQDPILNELFTMRRRALGRTENARKMGFKGMREVADFIIREIIDSNTNESLTYQIMRYYADKLFIIKLSKKEIILLIRSRFIPLKFLKAQSTSEDDGIRFAITQSPHCRLSVIDLLKNDKVAKIKQDRKTALNCPQESYEILCM